MFSRLFENKKISIQQSSFLWNMCGGMLNAFQSVLLLMVITRVLGLYEAGIFTIAYANANLFLTIGKYGMRNYQVTDVVKQFTFLEYLRSRWITTSAMIVVSVIYIVFISIQQSYPFEKSLVIICMCLLKSLDAVEDVYHGLYQQQGRLDIAAKLMTIRMVGLIIVFIFGIIILKNLLFALITTIIFNMLFLYKSICSTIGYFKKDITAVWSIKKIKKLLIICFPLFAGTFLSFYIGNAPKYAIDAQLNDELQACYGFISMPVFVIGLLNSFIYQPILTKLAQDWHDKKYNRFIKKIVLECSIIFLITIVAIIGGYFLGIPVLSLLYNTDLSMFKSELLILLAGGGMLALSGFLVIVLTIMRLQRDSVWGYFIIAVLAYFLSSIFVEKYEITGAALLYFILMSFLALLFIGTIILKLHLHKKLAIRKK